MNIQYDPDFIKKLKKLDVRIKKSFKEATTTFSKDPYDSTLNNHKLEKGWKNYSSIDVTADYRAIYQEIKKGEEIVAYFIAIGTHKELYR